MFIKQKDFCPSWDGYTLIQPSVSIGLVGQLAVDLILNNVPDMVKAGYLYDDCFMPAVGADPFQNGNRESKGVCTSCEVFQSKRCKLVIIQQRAPFVKGRIPSFRRKLIEWIKKYNFKQIVILGSCSSHIKNDVDIEKNAPLYLASQNYSHLESTFSEKFNWDKFDHTRPSLSAEENFQELFIPGAGITKSLFQDCSKSDIPVVALLVFSNEGVGSDKAVTVADGLGNLLSVISDIEHFNPGHWKIPSSWSEADRMSTFQPIF